MDDGDIIENEFEVVFNYLLLTSFCDIFGFVIDIVNFFNYSFVDILNFSYLFCILKSFLKFK